MHAGVNPGTATRCRIVCPGLILTLIRCLPDGLAFRGVLRPAEQPLSASPSRASTTARSGTP